MLQALIGRVSTIASQAINQLPFRQPEGTQKICQKIEGIAEGNEKTIENYL